MAAPISLNPIECKDVAAWAILWKPAHAQWRTSGMTR
jgi:hypothetical protein